MKRNLLPITLLLALAAVPAWAQQNEIPNPSFESWSGVDPLFWVTTNTPDGPIENVLQSSDARDGSSSVELVVQDLGFGVTLGGAVTSCPSNACRDDEGTTTEGLFPVSERYEAICGYYKADFVGGDVLFVAADFLAGAEQPVGGTDLASGDRCISTPANTWTFFRRPITYDPSFEGTPDLAYIALILLGSELQGQAHVGSFAKADSLHYCAAGPAIPETSTCEGGGAGIRQALLVVGDKDELTDADVIVQNTLYGLGYVVLLMSDDEVEDFSPAGVNVVVVAGSVEDGIVEVDWSTSAVPIVALEPDLFDDMLVSPSIASTSASTTAPVTALDIVASDHPIVAGASGTFDVFIEAHGMSFGSLGSGEGTVIARAENQKSVLFAYDLNERLADGVTVNIGRKVAFYMGEESATISNGAGMLLLRNAILWATHRENEIIIGLAIDATDAEVPADFALGQNYPNPFNPTTVIPFRLKQAGHVTIKVFDALGREVAVLVNEQLSAGSYTTDFQAHTLPSGVYLYQMQAGGVVSNRRMIVQK